MRRASGPGTDRDFRPGDRPLYNIFANRANLRPALGPEQLDEAAQTFRVVNRRPGVVDAPTMANPAGRPGLNPAVEALESRFLLAGSPYWGVAEGPAAAVVPPPRAVDDRYVVLDEVAGSHETPATAQRLPDLPYTGVVGRLDGGETLDVYRIPVDPRTSSLQFTLTWEPVPGAASPRLLLLNGQGRVLGSWPAGEAPGAGPPGFEVAPAEGSDLFIGIASGDATVALGGGPAVAYQLWVTRESAPGTATPGPVGGPGAVGGAATSQAATMGTLADLARPGPSAAETDRQPARMADGPAPTLSAGPSVGQFADDPASPAGPRAVATITLRWPGDHPREPVADPPDEDGSEIGAIRERAANALVAITGPGGSPLLEADAIDERLLRPSPGPNLPTGPEPGTAIAVHGPDLGSRREVCGNREVEDSGSPILVTGTSDRIPGAGRLVRDLAAVWTLNVVLSDPAVHDALIPRRPQGTGRSRGDDRRQDGR